MSFRLRLLLAVAVAALVPLGLFAMAARQETTARLGETYRQRTEAVADGIRHELQREEARLRDRLDALADDLRDDNRLRRALASGGDRSYRLDWAAGRMRSAGLDALQLQDDAGRILSSGHFRNEYGRLELGLPGALAASTTPTLVAFRRPEGPFPALAAARELELGGQRYALLGGVSVRDRLLGDLDRGELVTVTLVAPGDTAGSAGPSGDAATADAEGTASAHPGDVPAAGDAVTRVEVPWLASDRAGEVSRRRAALVVRHSAAPLRTLLARTDRWLLAALGAAGLGALLLAWWASSRLGRPLEVLADRARRLDLERLDVRFDREGREDEVGQLARTLDAMTERLRAGTARLREAERRAAVGDLARQVNHDVRNALAPLRNTVRHLGEAADRGPEEALRALREREGSLAAALDYLETLAGRYRDLGSRPDRGPSDVNEVVRRATEGLDPTGRRLRLELAGELPPARADDVALRRIVENLARNGLDALEDGGEVVVSTAADDASPPPADGSRTVRIAVRDTGPGIPREARDRVFEAFYTTRSDGSGLGLSIVRRLVNDLDGRLELESEPGRSTRFVVTLPAGGAT
jgi:signal transduction histidine kinase